MIRIVDTALYQWDTGRYITTDIEADHIHFSNKGDSKAVIMELADSKAKIPDYLLQTGKQLCVYVVRNGITVESIVFSVNQRERPESYIYDEDQRNFVYALIASAEAATDAANQAAEEAAQAGQNAGESANRANAAAEAAEKASDDANKAAVSASQAAKSLMVVGTAKGTTIRLDDAIEQFLVGCRIFGKTTQGGTPTPEAPVDMVSVGSEGSINLTVAGKNMLPYPFYQTTLTLGGVTYTDNKDGTVSVSGTTTESSTFWFTGYNFALKKGITYTLSIGDEVTATGNPNVFVYSPSAGVIAGINITSQNSVTFTPAENVSNAGIYVSAGKVGMTFTGRIKPQIELGAEVTPFEKYKAQKIILATTNGLNGIPVLANGDYTDEDGQQWICDEIDLDRGVRVERIRKVVAGGSSSITVGAHANGQRYCAFSPAGIAKTNINNSKIVLSNRYTGTAWSDANNNVYAIGGSVVVTDSRFTDKETALAILAEEQPEFRYVLATPVESELDEATIAAYKAFYTYKNSNTFYNDKWAYMWVEYVMNARKYIDNMILGTIIPATVE